MTKGRRLRQAIIIVAAWLAATRSQAAETAPAGDQLILDMMAGIPFENTFKELGATMPTGPFSSWTADQQRFFADEDLRKLLGLCAR